MKRNIFAIGLFLLFSVALWSCSNSSNKAFEQDTPEQNLTLEESFDVKAQNLDDAVIEITSSKGYEIITMNDPNSTKSGNDENESSRFSASITLDDVKGIYDYNPTINSVATEAKFGFQKVFEKTGDSDQFIIRLPKEKANHPWNLYMIEEGDSALINDFVVTTSDFHYEYTSGFQFDYLLDTRLDVEEEFAGDLYVKWNVSKNLDYEYESEYTFTDDYSVGVQFQFGDTIHYEYSLKNGTDVLYKEEIEITRAEDSHKREHEYSLTIGNIQIVKSSQSDSIVVYRDGILEANAVVEVLNNEGESVESDVAFCRKGRDLKITFEDGTQVVLSELLGDTLTVLDELFSSMSNLYFSEKLVNKVAWEVYYTNMATNSETATE